MKRFTSGTDETLLTGEVKLLGNDMVVYISGGSHPHVGAVAVGIPRPSLDDPEKTSASVSVFTMTGHKDDELARETAHRLAAALGRTVVAVAGFHIDGATPDQIRQVLSNCSHLLSQIVEDYGMTDGRNE
jgi:hypothetical protein